MSSPVEWLYGALKGPVSDLIDKFPKQPKEGEEVSDLRRVTYFTYNGFLYGGVFSVANMYANRIQGNRTRFLRFASHAGPAAMFGLLYSSTECISKNLRGKDDCVNTALGSAAACTVVAAKFGQRTAWTALVVGGGFMTFWKWLEGQGLKLTPTEMPRGFKDYGGFHHQSRHFGWGRPEVKEPTDY